MITVKLTLEQLNDLIDACHARAIVMDDRAACHPRISEQDYAYVRALEQDSLDYRNLAEYLRRHGE